MIGQYSSYQAALCAHNLEGHVVSLWANETLFYSYILYNNMFLVWNKLKPLKMFYSFNKFWCTSNRADIPIFWNNGFREKQEYWDGLAKAAPGNAGMVSVGQTFRWDTVTVRGRFYQYKPTQNSNKREKLPSNDGDALWAKLYCPKSLAFIPWWCELTYMGSLLNAEGMYSDMVFISDEQIETEPHTVSGGAGQQQTHVLY